MRVLFVCSGNRGVSPIISAQAESLRKEQLSVEIVPIIGKGMLGYLSNIGKLRREIGKADPDLIHAHYSFCGIVAALATGKPVVTSLMGSDVIHSGLWRWLMLFFVNHIWSVTIVKSQDMKNRLGSDKLLVVPNGVDTERFKPLPGSECRERLGWSLTRKIVLFAADPKRMEKNYDLALSAFRLLDAQDSDLKVVHGVAQDELPVYYNASDVVLLTSKWEGSPNTVKEAMACNVHVVTTKVGDIPYLFGDTKGYYCTGQTESELAAKLSIALQTEERPEGRAKIFALELDSPSISKRLRDIYQSKVRHGVGDNHK